MLRRAVTLLLLLPLLAGAGDTATVRLVPETLTPGQPFRMEIAIDSTDGFPGPALRLGSELPVIDDIPLRFGGQRMTSGSLTTLLVSGVAPGAPGDYTIPAFTATLAVRKIEIPATRLKVLPAPAGAAGGFARFTLELPDRILYVGESLEAAVRLEPGESERVSGAYGIEGRGEGVICRPRGMVNNPGQGPIRAELEITPTRAGTLDLRISGMALVDSASLTGRERPFAFSRKLRVQHAPERGRPTDWSGAVGVLTAGPATLSNPRPGIGEPTTLTLTVQGKGNLERMLAPEVPHGDAWDVQPVESAGRRARLEGQRSFSYTLIPRLPGKLSTPAVRISYFDPEKKAYGHIEFPPQAVTVSGQAPAKVELVAVDPSAPASGAAGAARVTELATPETGGRVVSGAPLLAQPAALAWPQAVGLLALAGALAWAARRDWRSRHPEWVRRRQARRDLRAARRRMRRAAGARDAERHAVAAVEALRAGAAPLLAASDRALTAEDILRAAPDLAGPGAVRAAFRRADGTRFGASPAPDTLACHEEIERCLGQLEQRLCD